MEKKVTWIVDPGITERTGYHGDLRDVIQKHGHQLIQVSYQHGIDIAIPKVDGCVVLYGSHQFTKAINPKGAYQPGALGVNDRTQATSYMSNLPLEWFLNRSGVLTTWAQFRQQQTEWFSRWGCERLFIRPNSGFKTFAGQCITNQEWDQEISSLEQLTSVMPETLMMVAPPQNILGEFRFVIADKKVIAGSEYRWDDRLDVRRDWPPECFEMAEKVAHHDWQVDVAYVCDVALTDNGPKVVELNSFSCAGLYACDLNAVVDGVSKAALKEFNVEDFDPFVEFLLTNKGALGSDHQLDY